VAAEPDVQIAEWVRDLGAERHAEREAATQRLWEAGHRAEAALTAAARSPDPEVSARARNVLRKIRSGHVPGMDAATVKLLEAYSAVNHDAVRKEIIVNLVARGGLAAHGAARLLCLRDSRPLARDLLRRQDDVVMALLRQLALSGRVDPLLALLREGVVAGNANYVGLTALAALLGGRLEEEIRYYEKEVPASETRSAVLARLYRADGDLDKAIAAAADAGDRFLLKCLLIESRNWARLVHEHEQNEDPESDEWLAFRAAFAYRAGDADRLEDTLCRMEKDAARTRCAGRILFNAYLASYQPNRLVESLSRAGAYLEVGQMLCIQGRYDELLNLRQTMLGDPRPQKETGWVGDPGEGPYDPANTLRRLQEKPRIRSMKCPPLGDVEEFRCQRRQRVQEAADVLTAHPDKFKQVLGKLYRFTTDMAACWQFLVANASNEYSTSLERLRFMEKVNGFDPDIACVEAYAHRVLKSFRSAPDDKSNRYFISWARVTCESVGATNMEIRVLSEMLKHPKAPDESLTRRMGNLLMEQGRWEEAAGYYAQGCALEPRSAVQTYLRGFSLDRAGRVEGRRLMRWALFVPLWDLEWQWRQTLYYTLEKRRIPHARQVGDVILRAGNPLSSERFVVLREQAERAAINGEYLKAADLRDEANLHFLRRDNGYLTTDASGDARKVASWRSMGYLEAGDRQRAIEQLDLCEAITMTGFVELTPELQQAAKDMALLDRCLERPRACLEGLSQSYPLAAGFHWKLADLLCVYRTDLDVALHHARKAAELTYDWPKCLSTLAEILFLTGRTDEAVRLARAGIRNHPRETVFSQQLQRFLDEGGAKTHRSRQQAASEREH